MIINMSRTATKTFYYNAFDQVLKLSNKQSFDYKVTRYIYTHKKYSDFHKVIVSVSKTDNEPLPLFFVQYYFDDKEHDIDFTPPCHRNNLNKDEPRQIMFPSVQNAVKSLASEGMKGKQIFQKLCNKAGDFSGARTPADIPNSTEKIHDICRKSKDYNKSDLVEILDVCKEEKGKTQ